MDSNRQFTYDPPGAIGSLYCPVVGDGKSGIEARDVRLKVALKAYLRLPPEDSVPLKLLHGRGPGIDIAKTLALEVYRDFPDKEKWL